MARAAVDRVHYRMSEVCYDYDDADQTCWNPRICYDEVSGSRLVLKRIQWARLSTPDVWHTWGYSCLEKEPPILTPEDVRRAMKRLDWGEVEFVIQPPDGRTLVNFKTNFYTEFPPVQTRDVELLGQRVTIEATVVEYVWHWGDGQTDTTTDPGQAWTRARPEVDVFHEYTAAEGVAPSLDVVLRGRFLINGEEPWTPIPETLTLVGPPVPLEVIEAHSVLVG